jgi:hypothetical protein
MHELLRQRQVQAQFLAHALHHVLGRTVADDHGQHRVDRHHAADEEGDRPAARGRCTMTIRRRTAGSRPFVVQHQHRHADALQRHRGHGAAAVVGEDG